MGSRIALVGVGLALVVAVVLLVRPDEAPSPTPTPSVTSSTSATPVTSSPEPSPTPAATEVDVVVVDGAVTTPVAAEVTLGDAVVLRITSDVADEVHLHGYDLETEVAAGGTGEIRFTADAPGVFEVEFHESGLLLLRLTVAP
ncbi:MAG: hypothetical protein ACKOKE_03590 [Actinomycetota bacterium]